MDDPQSKATGLTLWSFHPFIHTYVQIYNKILASFGITKEMTKHCSIGQFEVRAWQAIGLSMHQKCLHSGTTPQKHGSSEYIAQK